jgi:ankyrin repeat protein
MSVKDEVKIESPSLWRAAQNDDINELIQALDAGENLDEQLPELNDWTPIHYGCYLKSKNFVRMAIENSFDPWLVDLNGRRAIDIARTMGLLDIQNLLHKKMYPHGTLSQETPMP